MKRLFFTIIVLLFCLPASYAQNKQAKTAETKPTESLPSFVSNSDEDLNDFNETGLPNTNQEIIVNLDDCIGMALLNNKEIRAADYDVEAASWRLREAKAGGMPVFEYQVDMGPAPTNVDAAIESFFNGDVTLASRFHIELGIPVFTFGKLDLAQNLAKDGIHAEKIKKTQKENEIVVKVKKLYSGILLARDLLRLLKEADMHLTQEINRKESSEELADPVEVTKLKLFKFEISKKLYEAEQKESLALEGLRITLGISKNYKFELSDQHLTPVKFNLNEFVQYLEKSRKNNPQEALLQIGVHAKEKQYQLEKRKLAPDIGVGGFFEFGFSVDDIQGLTADDDFNNPFNFTRAAVGVRLKGKFDINGMRSNIKRTQAEYYSATLKKSIAKEGLELSLLKDYEQVSQSQKELKDSEKGRQLARQLVFLTKSNLDVGVGTANDYSDALKQYLIMRGRYLESVYNFNTAVAEFEANFENASEVMQIK